MMRLLFVAAILASAVLASGQAAVGEDDFDYPNDERSVIKTKKIVSSPKPVKHPLRKPSSSKDAKSLGNCGPRPDPPINGNIACSSHSGCRAKCSDGYRFPNGESELALLCKDIGWKIQGTDYSSVPHCEPICLPECKNNGICIAPNNCDCPENFSGAQCQFENKPCLNLPAIYKNVQVKCSTKTCTITCLSHFVFPDGSSVANLICKQGNWEPARSDWVTIPECQPVCKPACRNGGVCLSLNTCQCPEGFRGAQCQYREDACTSDKLGFNGGFSCASTNDDSFACTLTCPAGIDFEFPPATSYVCRYSTGQFLPQPIPRCMPALNSRMISVAGYESSSYYQASSNHSWSVQQTSGYSHDEGRATASSSMEYESGSAAYGKAMIKAKAQRTGRGDIVVEMEDDEDDEVEPKKPEAGTCFTWAGAHYKTFDGQIYSFESSCAYTLLKDTRDGLFTITAQNDCQQQSNSRCSRLLRIFVQGKEYALARNATTGLPEFRSGGIEGKVMPLPSQLTHLRVEPAAGNQLVASLDAVGLTIRWDGASLIQLDASESLWNRTSGLCGNTNADKRDDFAGRAYLRAAAGWKIDDIGQKCEEYASHHHQQQEHKCSSNPELEREAGQFCAQLLSDSRFKSCAELVDSTEFESACRWDYCSCPDNNSQRSKCACETMSVYVRQCAQKGVLFPTGWRNSSFCPMECNNGKVYSSCGPRSQAICGADLSIATDSSSSSSSSLSNELPGSNCEEGCFCPSGTVLHDNHCIAPRECPCRLRGKSFAPGSRVPKDCAWCMCTNGHWICTGAKCAARCSAVGDPHYTTFDGKRYDFMGHCSYYLIKADNYSVEAENAACSSAVSEMMGFVRTYQDGEPSCTKTVTIRLNDVAIKLKQNRQILVNGEDITSLPTIAGGAKLRIVSSIFVSVKLPNGIEVTWDGVSRVYVNAPAHFRGQTKGLCGTFTSNQKDDFLTPDGDVEQSVLAFANKWKTSELCADVKKDTEHPCDLNPQKRAAAEKYCSVLKKKIFLDCHWHVDPEPFYRDCLYDMCACEANVETCLCPSLSAYAKDCAQLGVIVPWRQDVPECQIHCPGDQEYQVCGNSCTRSCADISFDRDCKEECVEGCNCPKGQTLDVNGECIPIGQCPCTYAGLEFLAGYREVRPASKGQELCTCASGLWNCHLASADEIRDYPPVAQLKSLCSPLKHLEVTTCEPAEPRTCRNMHQPVSHSPAVCRPGCVCKPGYVLDLPSGDCVREQDCPCYHGGRSYKEASVMQEECNSCTCQAGKWNCTDIVCPGVCSVWGDSHYKTFDDREFDFQGACDYVLAKGKLSEAESFEVTIRNVPCGTTGVTCSKSITLTIGTNNLAQHKQESVTLTRGKSLSPDSFKGLERIASRRAGLFVFLDVPDLGLVLQWDEGTRVYLRLGVQWKGHARGLCGDFDDDASNDFKTPAGGPAEASASLFADSWKMSELCAEPQERQADTCARHPERKLWATQKCRVLKSALFEACHSEVRPDGYIERCIYDACACDDGGDCECLCTAIAAYAHECNARGVPIQWRSQKLCPMQCDESCSNYSPCVSTCPRETCDNLLTRADALHMCDQDICVEGCKPKACPEGEIYLNSSHNECIPRAACKTLCLVTEDGQSFYEGDWVRGDNCHECYCSRGKVLCKGSPCPSVIPTSSPPQAQQLDQTIKCTSGWTKWFNRDVPKEYGFRNDVEELPTMIELLSDEGSIGVCPKDKMIDIKCRTADTKQSYKEIGLNVDCSLDKGLICLASPKHNISCPDFEISVLCACELPTSPSFINECELHEDYRSTDNCFDYLQCEPGLTGNTWERKTCGTSMMFNANLQVCDFPTNVVAVRPECEQKIKRTFNSTTPAPVSHECALDERYRSVPENCFDFLQCGPGLTGNIWVRKTCGPGTMFNERMQICDFPNSVALLRPECGQTLSQTNVINQEISNQQTHFVKENRCKEDEYWNDCAIKCSKSCEYYKHVLTVKGICNTTTDCVAGCVPISRFDDCSGNDRYWSDHLTCVDRKDCACKSNDGLPVMPGTIVKVSECKICQCINNYYTCHESACKTNEIQQVVSHHEYNSTIEEHNKHRNYPVVIVPSTVTPPRACDESNYIWLTEKSPFDVTFGASSYQSSFITAESARLRRVSSMLTWRPEHDDGDEWVEVRLKRSQPIYGLIVAGDAFEDKYVTSYVVLFSDDGQTFSYVLEENGQPRVHRGPVDAGKPVRQIFRPPIEAKVVRINPVTWHKGIAMQVELVGCEEATTTPAPTMPTFTTPIITETIITPECDDLLGYDDRRMSDQQVSFSSSANFNGVKPDARLSSHEVWRPLLDNPDQYVQFDFMEPRKLTGIETKGGNGIWTTAYKVYYSSDGKKWNPVIDGDTGMVKEFLGNVDDYSGKVNYFKMPIRARLLKIMPTKWHRQIGLKIEIHGCYVPYPLIELPATIPPAPPTPASCNVCNGVFVDNAESCKCERSLWWDGRFCVTKQECPCIVGHVTYPVGSSYETSDCQHCLCTLGGSSACQAKVCGSCPNPLERPVLTELCACLCKPCPAGKRLCPTSNDCVDESSWCNGIQDCPDDEIGCQAEIVIANTTVIVTNQTTIKIKCETSCPPGFVMEPETVKESYGTGYAKYDYSIEKSESFNSSFTQKIIKMKVPAPVKLHSRFGEEADDDGGDGAEKNCPKFVCKPLIQPPRYVQEKCPKVECPEGFQAKFDQSKSYRKNNVCDNTCVPIPAKERLCNVDGRLITTFDNLLYKYDICNHILARDRLHNRWFIVAEQVCKGQESLTCLKSLVVRFGEHVVLLHPDMYAVIDGNTYSPSELKRLGDKHPAMKLSRVGEALRLESRRYPFWLLLGSDGSVKIGASEELAGNVDGLCGYMNGLPENDQVKPDGQLAKSSQDFGDSWKVLDSAECRLQECPEETRREAWKMCALVKEASFDACSNAVDREKFVASCLESSCACLNSGNATSQECRCRALSSFVTSCLAADKSVELAAWRSVYDCPAVCEAPFVHRDCFRNKCEMSCENLQEANPCPVMDELCVPGCFCPEGMVRYGETCLPPSECRDCICDGLGDSKYVTFDGLILPFEGNCSYILSRDVVPEGSGKERAYQVVMTNGACNDGTCIEAISVLYKSHVVQLRKGVESNQVSRGLASSIVMVDNQEIDIFPYKTSWLELEKSPNRDVKLVILPIQLELNSFKNNFAFMFRIPSHSFGGAMEGLCGDCNGVQQDELRKYGGQVTEDTQEFGNSWLVKDLPASLNLDNAEHCTGKPSKPKNKCVGQWSAVNYCERLLIDESFARCHGSIDPRPYYQACADSLCYGTGDGCAHFEAYARKCTYEGICLDWRSAQLCPYRCPKHLEYRACGSGCLETCESLDKKETCKSEHAVEGCFCPVGQVLRNGTCVSPRDCFVCDAEGHAEGDTWRPNKCTECTCRRPGIINCQETSCSSQKTVCDENSRPKLVPGTEDDCCPKYSCVPIPAEVAQYNCAEAVEPECGFAQVLKTTVDANGCQKFICQCVPADECPYDIDVRFTGESEQGFVSVTNTSGCCPRTTKVCKPELCPQAQECKRYYVPVLRNPDSCCNKYECEPPRDMCIYYTNNDFNFELDAEAKEIGEIWQDGPCKTCVCELQDGLPLSKCSTKDCLKMHEHPDSDDYVLQELKQANQCCPVFVRSACKHAGGIYQIGESWQAQPNEACVTTECALDEKLAPIKRTSVQNCSIGCELGYRYQPPLDPSVTCCGECVAVACVVDGQLKNVGEIWYSEDHCAASTCVAAEGSMHVHVVRETCEAVSSTEMYDYKVEEVKVPGKCCPNLVRTACYSDGRYYQPGETWKSNFDNCVVESCVRTVDGNLLKQRETQTCNTECPKGWEYQQPINVNCCGECKPVYCIFENYLYHPGQVWYSNDNCTTYSCIQSNDQLLVSTSKIKCPELDCAPEYMYYDGCCQKCNVPVGNQEKQDCAVEVLDFSSTIGMVVEKTLIHGVCRNFEPIEGFTVCHGHCESSTYYDTENWSQIIDCNCCQPVDYRKIPVELTCDNGRRYKKELTVPTTCSCEACSSERPGLLKHINKKVKNIFQKYQHKHQN